MRPIDIQNAIDRVQAGERILHSRKLADGNEADHFAKRLSDETEQKRTQVNDAEQSGEGLQVEEEGGGKNQYSGKQKKNKENEEEKSEEQQIKEEGKGNILDLNA